MSFSTQLPTRQRRLARSRRPRWSCTSSQFLLAPADFPAPAFFSRRSAGGRTVVDGGRAEQPVGEVLLADRPDVAHEPVDHQAARRPQEHDAEHQRHDHHDPLLRRIRGGRRDLLLPEHRDGHQDRDHEVRVGLRQIVNPAAEIGAAQLDRLRQQRVEREQHRHRAAASARSRSPGSRLSPGRDS